MEAMPNVQIVTSLLHEVMIASNDQNDSMAILIQTVMSPRSRPQKYFVFKH